MSLCQMILLSGPQSQVSKIVIQPYLKTLTIRLSLGRRSISSIVSIEILSMEFDDSTFTVTLLRLISMSNGFFSIISIQNRSAHKSINVNEKRAPYLLPQLYRFSLSFLFLATSKIETIFAHMFAILRYQKGNCLHGPNEFWSRWDGIGRREDVGR